MNTMNTMNNSGDIMNNHNPADDPFAALSDDTDQLTLPSEYGSGLSDFLETKSSKEDEDKSKSAEDITENKPEEHPESPQITNDEQQNNKGTPRKDENNKE